MKNIILRIYLLSFVTLIAFSQILVIAYADNKQTILLFMIFTFIMQAIAGYVLTVEFFYMPNPKKNNGHRIYPGLVYYENYKLIVDVEDHPISLNEAKETEITSADSNEFKPTKISEIKDIGELSNNLLYRYWNDKKGCVHGFWVIADSKKDAFNILEDYAKRAWTLIY